MMELPASWGLEGNTTVCREKQAYSAIIPTIYGTIFLGLSIVVLYDCEIWPLTLREKYELQLFENKTLRNYYDSKGMQ
jgi:hypothetical protein